MMYSHSECSFHNTEVTSYEWQRYKDFVQFTHDDKKSLAELHPTFAAQTDEMIDALYERLNQR